MKDLGEVTQSEQVAFFDSFDHVLCDTDGVLCHFQKPIPGALSAINSLRDLSKKVIFVSNKTTISHEEHLKQLNAEGFGVSKTDLIVPEVAIISHLKGLKFDRDIFYLGLRPFRDVLIKSGFRVAESPPYEVEELIPEFTRMSMIDNRQIGAVITDVDPNMNYLKMRRASVYLKRSDVLYLTANSPSKHLNELPTIFNSGYFDSILEDFTGRKGLRFAKPSLDFNDFIRREHKISDPGRVLVIGDSVEEDMAFASNCGYRKLLVLSGITTIETVRKWTFPDDYRPDYYIDSLQTINDILAANMEK